MANSLLSPLVSLLNRVTLKAAAEFTALAICAGYIGTYAVQIPDKAAPLFGRCSSEQIEENNAVKAELNVDQTTLVLSDLQKRAKDNVRRSNVNCFRETYSIASGKLYHRYRLDSHKVSETESMREACVEYAPDKAWLAKCAATGSATQSPSAPLAPSSASNMPQAASNMAPQPTAPRSSAGKKKASASARTSKPLAVQPNITINNNYFGERPSSTPSGPRSPNPASDGGAPMPDSARDVSSNMIGPR